MLNARFRRFAVAVVVVLAVVTGIASTTTPADEGFDPFPCDTVCVPVPYFPFIICAPSCPPPPPPGP